MATRYPRDWNILDLDPVEEIKGAVVCRNKNRKLTEYPLSKITFFTNLLTVIQCFLPGCGEHRKYGLHYAENIPVIFKHHDFGQDPIYVPFKNPICRPLRVPADGDVLLGGIKWKILEASSVSKVIPCIFDCFIAALKERLLSKEFCLECLLVHQNGLGLFLERLIRTILMHIVPMAKKCSKSAFLPWGSREKTSEMKLRRISWGANTPNFRLSCIETNCGFMETFSYFVPKPEGLEQRPSYIIDLNAGILRHLETVSRFNVLVRCVCGGGRIYPKQAFIGVLNKAKKSHTQFNITLAQWANGEESADPLWNWSLMGSDVPSESVLKSNLLPITSICPKCKSSIGIVDVQTPDTTWVLMAEFSQPLQKTSVGVLKHIRNYSLGGATFFLAFVLLYNKENGHFSSLHFYNEKNRCYWRLFDDARGGFLRDCNPSKVNYNERVNLRAFYFRTTESNPHRCLLRANQRSMPTIPETNS